VETISIALCKKTRSELVKIIIAPIVEECFKLLMILCAMLCIMIQNKIHKKQRHSLTLVMYALCAAAGLALSENLGYVAACHWSFAQDYCLPNEKGSVMATGVIRGLISVPFHCMTAILIALMCCGAINNIRSLIWRIPLSIVVPILLHSAFNASATVWRPLAHILSLIGWLIALYLIEIKYTLNSHAHEGVNDINSDPKSIGMVCTKSDDIPLSDLVLDIRNSISERS